MSKLHIPNLDTKSTTYRQNKTLYNNKKSKAVSFVIKTFSLFYTQLSSKKQKTIETSHCHLSQNMLSCFASERSIKIHKKLLCIFAFIHQFELCKFLLPAVHCPATNKPRFPPIYYA